MLVYTSTFYYSGSDRLDCTVMTGNKAFAPTWELVRGYKNGTINMVQYTERYEALMKESMKKYPDEWKKLASMDRVVLVCYCGRNAFCHRRILARLLAEYFGAQNMGEL